MNESDQSAAPPHDQARSLIWYVNGTLPDRERLELEQHLASCEACRAELQSVRALRGDMRAAYEAEPGPSPRARREVFDRIRAEQAGDPARLARPARPERTVPRLGLLGSIGAWLRTPLVPGWASAAAIVLIVVQAGVLLQWKSDRGIERGDVTTRAISRAQTRLRLVFNPQASEPQIRQLLQSLNARIVNGPTADGAYVVELAPMDPVTLEGKLKSARANADVLQSVDFATP